MNPAVVAILGWSAEEFLARPLIEMVHAEDREATLRQVARLVAGEVTFNFVNRYAAKDGGYRWLDWEPELMTGERWMDPRSTGSPLRPSDPS